LGQCEYSHDNSGLISLKTINGQSTNYGYDSIGRLINANDQTYEYDVAGNSLPNNCVYNTITNELTADGDFDYIYDAGGNLLSKVSKIDGSHKNYIWDSRNQLLKVQSYDMAGILFKELSFTYGPLGRRLTKTVNGITHTYLYDGMDIVAIMDTGNQLILSTILHSEYIDTPLSINTDDQSYYYHRDHQGNILALTDSNQNEVESYSYDAYGVTSHSQTVDTNNPYTYTGREYDDEDLYYYRARYYDPQTQRFLSKDPIGFAGGDFNLYRYVLNDPVNMIDPLGLEVGLPGESSFWTPNNTHNSSKCSSNNDKNDCLSKCLQKNYGDLYTWASALSPLSMVSAGLDVYGGQTSRKLKQIGLKKLHTDYKVGKRMLKTGSQFGKFNSVMAVVGAGALGFQVGALGYCYFSCL